MLGDDNLGVATVSTKREFGRVLTRKREAAGLTVRELARKADVPAGTVSGWCTGRHLPTLTQKEIWTTRSIAGIRRRRAAAGAAAGCVPDRR